MFTTLLQQHFLIHRSTKASQSNVFMLKSPVFDFCWTVYLSLNWVSPILNTSVVFVVATESRQRYWQWYVLGLLWVEDTLLEQQRSFVFGVFFYDHNLCTLRYQLAEERSPLRLYCLHISHAHPACAPTAAANPHSPWQPGPAPPGLFLSMALTTNHFYHCTLISSCCRGDRYAAQGCVTAAGEGASGQQVPLCLTASSASDPDSLFIALSISKVRGLWKTTPLLAVAQTFVLILDEKEGNSKTKRA